MAAGPGQARPGAAHWLPSALPGPGPPGSSGGDSAWLLETCRPRASLGWRRGCRREDETTRVTPPRFSGPSPRHLPSRPTDFSAGVLRGAGRRHRRRIPRGCPPLPRSLAFPEALGGPAPLLLTFSSLQPTRVSRRLPLDFEHVCREERAWEGRALAFAALGRGPGAHFPAWACRGALPVSSRHGCGVRQMQTVQATASPNSHLPVRPRRPRQRVTGQVGVQRGTLCVCTLGIAAARQGWSQDARGPLSGAEPRDAQPPAGERKQSQRSRRLPPTPPGGGRLRLPLSPRSLFFHL